MIISNRTLNRKCYRTEELNNRIQYLEDTQYQHQACGQAQDQHKAYSRTPILAPGGSPVGGPVAKQARILELKN